MVLIKQKGFSLIEVLVTMLITSVGTLALGNFYLTSMESERVSQERVAAVHMAEQIIEVWQNTNINPTPDCEVAGAAAGVLVIGTELSSCVMNNGVSTPFNILINESPVKAPIPNGHQLHSNYNLGAGAANDPLDSPEFGELLISPAVTLTVATEPAAPRVMVRTVKVSWPRRGSANNMRSVSISHITGRL